MRKRTRPSAFLLVCLLLAGCGGSVHSAAPSRRAEAAAFHDAPAALVSLHSQADQLLGGGPGALRTRLAALRRYPVVINKWASWCGPCQSEFPAFQKASVRYGREVAFIGVDSKDGNGAASDFLRRFPVSYPSYTDPTESIAAAIQAVGFYPQTLFFAPGRHGSYVYDHAGPYADAAALERDIRRYLLR